jgi:hypothetical protein
LLLLKNNFGVTEEYVGSENSDLVLKDVSMTKGDVVDKELNNSTSGLRLKVKLTLCFNSTPRHEGVLREWRYSSTHSLPSALDEGEWSASRPLLLYPQGKKL